MFNRANEINEELEQLYNANIASAIDIMNSDDKLSDLLLLWVDDRYFRAEKKIMIVGQETYNCWGFSELPRPIPFSPEEYIKRLMRQYDQVHWGKIPDSLFWRSSDYIYESLNSNGPDIGFMWNNIDKLDYDNGHNKWQLPDRYRTMFHNQFNVLPSEIKILKPDIVIFFIGDRYDKYLEDQGAKLESTELGTGISFDDLARVSWEGVLPERSFATWHPTTLSRRRKRCIIDKIIKLCE